MARLLLPLLLLLAFGAGGCHRTARPADFIQPSIAVMKFENRAPYTYQWDLGTGTKDILVDRLMKTQRFHVIERPEIDSVLRELQLQNSGMTRAEERAKMGQLKNVQYLIKGTITDFGHVGSASAKASNGTTTVGAAGTVAIMAMILYVVNVESGEIITSETIQECVNAGKVDFTTTYRNIAFGGSIFYRTPLGQATTRAIERAVDRITETIANRPWQPKIAGVQSDRTVIINGGSWRGLAVGQFLDVFQPGDPITDPDTGDIIAHHPGKTVGRLRIVEVAENHSVAVVQDGVAGDFQVGQACRRVAR